MFLESIFSGGFFVLASETDVSAEINTIRVSTTPEGELVIDDALSEVKVIQCDVIEDYIGAINTIINENVLYAPLLYTDMMYVSNCVLMRVENVTDVSISTENLLKVDNYKKYLYLQYNSETAAQSAVQMLSNMDGVQYAETDEVIEFNDPISETTELINVDSRTVYESWGVRKINANLFANYVNEKTNDSIVVAVIDTGVDTTHHFLENRITNIRYNVVTKTRVVTDQDGHGTHVAGIIADCTQGLNVKIMPIKVFDDNGKSSSARVVAGIEYAISSGADVINLSMRGDHHISKDNAVSEAVAMAKLIYPTASPAELENLLKYNCEDLGADGPDIYYGHGILDMSNMITNLPFIDISKKDWYYNGVFYSYNRGIMTGKDSFHFDPISTLQRQDFILMLYRSAGSPGVTYRQIFSDVSSTDYFANAAVWAYDNYLMRGIDGKLGVGDSIRREDFATVLYRYAQYRGLNVSEKADISAYPDSAGISAYAVDPMRWAVAKGIISGNGETWALDPARYADRAAVATMMMRFYQAYMATLT